VLEQLSGQTPVFSKGIIAVLIFSIVESLVSRFFDELVDWPLQRGTLCVPLELEETRRSRAM